jgi:DHA2 family multidrug resistance protein
LVRPSAAIHRQLRLALDFLHRLTPEPLINLRLLGQRNFGLRTLGNFLLGFALYSSAYLLPQYLAAMQGFDSKQPAR